MFEQPSRAAGSPPTTRRFDVMTTGLLNGDRAVVLGSLVSIIVLAWSYMLLLAPTMPVDAMEPNPNPWSATEFVVMFVMWAVMMVAMMLPSAVPMLLVFASVNRARCAAVSRNLKTGAFLIGYLALWAAFSFLATIAQWILHSAGLVSPHVVSISPMLSAVLLIVAGLYQFTPFKHACLARCRTPLGFVLTEWRNGLPGALYMGIRHGLFCVGCCWLLMALLFVAGVMNILWIAFLAIVILAEKVVKFGDTIARAIGVCAFVWGVWLVADFGS